jgi:hypothetical protein
MGKLRDLKKGKNGGRPPSGPAPAEPMAEPAAGPTRVNPIHEKETREVDPRQIGYEVAKEQARSAKLSGSEPDVESLLAGVPDEDYSQIGRLLEPSSGSGPDVSGAAEEAKPVTDSMFIDSDVLKETMPSAVSPVSGAAQSGVSAVSVPQAQAPQPSPADLGVVPTGSETSVIMGMDKEVFVFYARGECKKRGIGTVLDFLGSKDPSIKTLAKAAVVRELLDSIFQENAAPIAATPVQAPQPQAQAGQPADRTTVRPPPRPPQRQSEAPPSTRVGGDPVSGDESTVFSSMTPPQQPAPPAQAKSVPPRPPSRRPPPPPRTQAGNPSAAAKFLEEIEQSDEPTKPRRDKAQAFYDNMVRDLMAKYGRGKIREFQASANQKHQMREAGQDVSIEPIEELILDLNKLSAKIAEFDRFLAQEEEFHQAQASAKPSRPPPPGQKPSSDPKARKPSQPPPSSSKEDGKSGEHGENGAEKRSSRPPADVAPVQERPGWFRRVFGTPMTYTLSGIGVFSGALVYKHSFQEMASGLSRLYQMVMHRSEPPHIPVLAVVAGYAAVMASIIGLTEWRRRRKVRLKTKLLEERDTMSKDDLAKERYVVAEIRKIQLNKSRWQEQGSELRTAMRRDPAFFEALLDLRKKSWFADTLRDELALKPDLIANFWTIFRKTGIEIMQKKLSRLARKDILYSPRDLNTVFRKMYEEDTLFRKQCDEVFFTNVEGAYVNHDEMMETFAVITDEEDKFVGEELRKALMEAYQGLHSRKK